MEHLLLYSGKVREVFDLGKSHLLMKATDRVSCFDKNVGVIPGKGELLNKMSEFWFNQTKDIIDNHLISTNKDVALVKKCTPFAIEVVIRGYITGNTSTSLWTHYKNGVRNYCGITFPEGLTQHQRLPEPVITPTTKGVVDKPISRADIIAEKYMTEEECDYVFAKAMRLFKYGQQIADEAGLILVDTKYEFGKDENGKILLIDEVHTCDSSRYWIKSTYQQRIENDLSPEKLDKDCVRDWVKANCNPYVDEIPEIPEEIINKALSAYQSFYDKITGVKPSMSKNLVLIVAGSVKDDNHICKIIGALHRRGIACQSFISSAHKNTRNVMRLIEDYEDDDRNIVWVTIAGRSNALSGVVASNSRHPVIACPPFKDHMDMMVNINSTLQCPSNVPVMTILEPGNVALCIKKMFAFAH